MWEAGAIAQIDLPDLKNLTEEVKDRPDLKEQLRELRECAELGVRKVAEAVQESIGMGVGVEALSQWERFGRFCRQSLGVEPLALMTGFELVREDPAAEVLAAYPDAKPDEAKGSEWATIWTREWDRSFQPVVMRASRRQPAPSPARSRRFLEHRSRRVNVLLCHITVLRGQPCVDSSQYPVFLRHLR